MINASKLDQELKKAGIAISGCNAEGVVWDVDGVTEIQSRPDVAAVIAVHDPEPDPPPPSLEDQIATLQAAINALINGQSNLASKLVDNNLMSPSEAAVISSPMKGTLQ